jgi:hypothetical protein
MRRISNSLTLMCSLGLVAFGFVYASEPLEAKGGRQIQSEDYKFKKPMHGYEGGASGGYYCSYVRIPKRVCKTRGGREVCKVKGWILRQECR